MLRLYGLDIHIFYVDNGVEVVSMVPPSGHGYELESPRKE